MYLSYYSYSNENIEGVGAQYQRIIGLLCIAKYHKLKYIHIPIKIGHNYDKDLFWNEKWDKMFNINKLSNNNEININLLNKEYNIHLSLDKLQNQNTLYFFHNPLDLFYSNINEYLSNIQKELINIYDENNNYRKLIYNKNKINIAIHIRVINDYDDEHEYNNYINNTSNRFTFTCEMYKKLINYLKNKYLYADIHIFSQYKYFDLKYKDLRNINNIKLHFDDIDHFDTFHHLCKADVLVLGLSTFSILAGFYNKNTVIYLNFATPPLKSWIIYNN